MSVDGNQTAAGGAAVVAARRLRRERAAFGRAWLRAQLLVEAEARSAFHLVPIGMMIGILAVFEWSWRPSPWVCAAISVPFAATGWWGRRHATIAVLFAAVALGAASAAYELRHTDTVVFSGESTVRIEGRVLWRDRDDRGRMRYLVAIERTERPVLSRPPQRAELLVTARHTPIEIGQRYYGLVRLRAPSGPALPGGYDFAFGAFFEGLGAYGFALGAPESVGSDGSSLTATERFVRLRLAISGRIRSVVAGPEGAVAAAIVAGERSGIPDDVERWLRVTGLSHVLSISGLHMALVAGFAMVLVRCACAAVPAVALRIPAKKMAAVVALGVSAFYLALAGLDVATTRSFLMIAIMLTAVLFDRAALTLRNVALAAIVIFVATPHALLTASFQMSFGATAAIIGIYGAITRWHRARSGGGDDRILMRVGGFLVGIAVSSTVAGFATAPYAAYHFQRMAPFGLIANMLALPLFSFWIMPLALIGMIAMPLGLDAVPFWLLGKGLTLVFLIARHLAGWLPDSPTGLLTSGGLAVLTLALLAACFLASRLRLLAVPLALIGMLSISDRSDHPELLIFEDGREVAIIDANGDLAPLKARPNGFVFGQWERAYPSATVKPAEGKPQLQPTFACETIADEPRSDASAATPSGAGSEQPADLSAASVRKTTKGFAQWRYCRATTRTGLRIAWTDDYRRLGQACEESDVAIVARAVRLTACRSGAHLVTLRTLRTTGSLSVSRAASGDGIHIVAAIAPPGNEWNRHRAAPWPEAWRRPPTADAPTSP